MTPTLHTRLVWGLVAAVAVADIAFLALGKMKVAPAILLSNAAVITLLAGLHYLYTRIRPDARIAALAHMGAAGLAFTAAAAILSFATTKLGGALIDEPLAALDKTLGLDWLAHYKWILSHNKLHAWMMLVYWTLAGQLTVVFIALNFIDRSARAWEALWLYMLAALSAIIIAAFLPAAGAFGHYGVQADEPYLRAFMGLRDGTIDIVSRETVQGVVQFPSLHTAWAVVYAYAARGVKWLFYPLLALNIGVIAATPAIGGHHYADVLAGLALAAGVIAAVNTMARRGWLPADAAQNKN